MGKKQTGYEKKSRIHGCARYFNKRAGALGHRTVHQPPVPWLTNYARFQLSDAPLLVPKPTNCLTALKSDSILRLSRRIRHKCSKPYLKKSASGFGTRWDPSIVGKSWHYLIR